MESVVWHGIRGPRRDADFSDIGRWSQWYGHGIRGPRQLKSSDYYDAEGSTIIEGDVIFKVTNVVL